MQLIRLGRHRVRALVAEIKAELQTVSDESAMDTKVQSEGEFLNGSMSKCYNF